jgi:hypothetical protein
MRNVRYVRQIEVHPAESLVPGPRFLEVENTTAKLETYKSPGSDRILVELTQAGGEIILSVIHKLVNSGFKKEELPDQMKESIIVPICKKGDKIDCGKYCEISLLSTS